MTECPPRCGACCDPVVLSFDPATWPAKAAAEGAHWTTIANAAFAAKHWTLREHGINPPDETPVTWRMTCTKFDTTSRRCTAYEDRPPICADYPWYHAEPRPEAALDNVCTYHADVPGRRVLPLTVLTPGGSP